MKYSIEEIAIINKQISEINNQLISAQSKLELKKQQQKLILDKYNINSEDELIEKKLKISQEIELKVEEAKKFMDNAKSQISEINSLLSN